MPWVVRACGPGCRQGPLLPAGPAVSFLRDESSAEYSACNYTRDELMFAAQTFPVKALGLQKRGGEPRVALRDHPSTSVAMNRPQGGQM